MIWNRRRIVDARLGERAQQQFAAVSAERDELKIENESLVRRLEWITRELADITTSMRELRAAVLARQNAQAELVSLYRERAIQRAQTAERDFMAPLQ